MLSERDVVFALYEILRGLDFQTATEKQIRKQLAEKLGLAKADDYKRLVNKHVSSHLSLAVSSSSPGVAAGLHHLVSQGECSVTLGLVGC